jgi:hypothetical protein
MLLSALSELKVLLQENILDLLTLVDSRNVTDDQGNRNHEQVAEVILVVSFQVAILLHYTQVADRESEYYRYKIDP